MKCKFVQADTCGSPVCTVLCSRHHPWVSRLPAGLKWAETSFIAINCWPGNSPATLFLFSLPSEQCCSYELSHNNLCWDCHLYIVWTAGGNGLFPPATTAGGQKWTFACEHLCCGGGLGSCVTSHLNSSWADRRLSVVGPAAWDEPRVLRRGVLRHAGLASWESSVDSPTSKLLGAVQTCVLLCVICQFVIEK